MPGRKLQQYPSDTSPSHDVSPSIMITVIILAIAVILSASLYLLLRFLRRHRTTPTTTDIPHLHPSHKHINPVVSPILDSLPLFTYDRLTTRLTGDCAVCLSKFSTRDMLRLLPLCCHAFHKDCIDTWLSSSLTCPLCRTPVLPSDHSGSFRVDIGSVSSRRQRDNDVPNIPSGEIYAISGEFDYVIPADNDVIADIPVTAEEYYKEVLASEVGTRGGGGGGWLKDYLSSSITSSRTASFRGSGRMFFTGSSRRTELGELDGASRLGEEISELFRWLSGA